MYLFRICIALLISVFFVTHGVSAAGSKKNLRRKIDHVVVKGKLCSGIIGQPITNYNLYASKNGTLIPIPFQIDELDEDGEYVLTHGEEKSQDSDKGLFDKNDELAFMAKDSGDKIKNNKILPGDAKGCIEIVITDPVNTRKGWAYLVYFNKPHARSKTDYVNYDAKKMLVTARNYLTEFDKERPAAGCRYAFWKGLGGNGTDLLDRVKVRVHMKVFLVTFKRTEEDITVREDGHIDGPVRVIIHTKNVTPLILGIPASTSYQNTIYYYTHADFPFAVQVTVKPAEMKLKIIDDMVNCTGWKFYTSTNPKGIVINGKMNEQDKKLDLSPWKWSVLSNNKFGFWSRWFSPSFSTVKVNLYYNDDIKAKDELEDIQGENPGIGYDFSDGWLELEEDYIEFRLVHFYTKGYKRGMEKEVTSVHDRPLKVSAKKIK